MKRIATASLCIVSAFVLAGCSNTITMPDVTGMNVEKSKGLLQDESKKFKIKTSDITVLNRDDSSIEWITCGQSVEKGNKVNKSEEIILYFGKNQKECETKTEDKDVIMPELNSITVSKAEEKLKAVSPNFVINLKDATEENRSIWDSDNWIVCTQSIKSGKTIVSDSEVNLTYARDKNECEGKKITPIAAEETTPEGLTASTAKDRCVEEFNLIDFRRSSLGLKDVKLHSIIGESHALINDEWYFRISVDADDLEGEMRCSVGGTEKNPKISHMELNIYGLGILDIR